MFGAPGVDHIGVLPRRWRIGKSYAHSVAEWLTPNEIRHRETSPNLNQMHTTVFAVPTNQGVRVMASFTKRSVETLIDLVEIKLSCLQVFDRDDAKELAALEQARRELVALVPGRGDATVVNFPDVEAQRAAG
tara:strand:- start:42 stop:440 length:399 start_codon:yes stop_codon:yes gene_type:complete